MLEAKWGFHSSQGTKPELPCGVDRLRSFRGSRSQPEFHSRERGLESVWGGFLVPAELMQSCLGMHVFEKQPGLKEVVSLYAGWTEAMAV